MLGRRSANILKDNKGDGCGCSGGSEDGDDKCFATTGSPMLARPPAPRLFSGDRFTVPFFAISVCTAGEKKKTCGPVYFVSSKGCLPCHQSYRYKQPR